MQESYAATPTRPRRFLRRISPEARAPAERHLLPPGRSAQSRPSSRAGPASAVVICVAMSEKADDVQKRDQAVWRTWHKKPMDCRPQFPWFAAVLGASGRSSGRRPTSSGRHVRRRGVLRAKGRDITAKSAADMFAHLAPSPRYRSPSFAKARCRGSRDPGHPSERRGGPWPRREELDTVVLSGYGFRQLASFRSKDSLRLVRCLMPASPF